LRRKEQRPLPALRAPHAFPQERGGSAALRKGARVTNAPLPKTNATPCLLSPAASPPAPLREVERGVYCPLPGAKRRMFFLAFLTSPGRGKRNRYGRVTLGRPRACPRPRQNARSQTLPCDICVCDGPDMLSFLWREGLRIFV
jgi:hypothetical protein